MPKVMGSVVSLHRRCQSVPGASAGLRAVVAFPLGAQSGGARWEAVAAAQGDPKGAGASTRGEAVD